MADKIQMQSKLMNRKMELRNTPRTKLLKDIKYIRNFKRHLLLQSCPTLCDPVDSSPPGFPVLGILQARILEWVAILGHLFSGRKTRENGHYLNRK